MNKYIKNILIFLIIILELYLIIQSNEIINELKNTINIILYTLLPTMFFSILFSEILIKLDFLTIIPNFIIKFFSKLFNVSKDELTIIILSFLSGYPNNAKMLNSNKNLNNIINYTSIINPIFILATLGNIYLKNIKIALLIYTSIIISNIIIGIILKNKNKQNEDIIEYKNTDFFFSSLKNTPRSLVNIFSNIFFFSIIISFLKNILPNNIISYVIYGIIEFSNGIYFISNLNIDIYLKSILIIIIFTFGSFSIHMQMMTLNNNIKYKKFIFIRILNIISSIIIFNLLYYFFY